MNIALFGMGRMGKLIARRLIEEHMDIVAAFDVAGSPAQGKDVGTLIGMPPTGVVVSSADKVGEALKKTKPDVAVDFSVANACLRNMKIAAANGVDMVIGTTGLNDKQMAELEKEITKNQVGAVISPNMSVGVNVFWKLVRRAARMLKDYDIEIVEAHHKRKEDSPSGTALKTAEIITEELGKSLDGVAVYGRKGKSARREGEIGIHAVRAGDIVGDHTVLFGTDGEHIEIKHSAHSREAFVNGVVKATIFIKGKKGIYGMNDVLRLK